RDAAAERARVTRLQQKLAEANQAWESAHQRAVASANAPVSEARAVFEEVGASRARAHTLSEVITEHQARVQSKEAAAADLRRQIDELRAQLQRYSEALENDLSAGRDRIATRVREALAFEKSLAESSSILMKHLEGRPECVELLDELRDIEARFRRQEMPSEVAAPPSPPRPGFRT
ncbi:MAG: hypothetical protein KC668_31095, partial [Myxococcales bacterium]|nr:hypothetical protein [Myxococcales bacterium]